MHPAGARERESTLLARWGRFVHRRRGIVLLLSALLLAISVAGVLRGGTLRNTFPEDTDAGRGFRALQAELPETGGASFTLLFTHPTLTAADLEFRAGLEAACADVAADPRVRSVETPWDAPGGRDDTRISESGRRALVVVTMRDEFAVALTQYEEVRNLVRPGEFEVLATEDLAINHDFEVTLEKDLQRAEVLSLPASLVLLVLVFGTVVAALLPLGVGILAVTGGVAAVFALSGATDVATYAVNVVTLVGLGVAIDYSLFVVTRFREETARGLGVEDALARTMATAGRATLFSGLTVAIGLSGLLFFQGSFLASMGLGGTMVVGLAVVYSLTFLPAVLAYLGARVERLGVPFLKPAAHRRGFWHALAVGVMRRPILVLVPCLALLLVAGAPFLDLRLANGDVHVLPEETESRRAYDLILAEFPDQDQTRMLVLVRWADGTPLTAARVEALYDYSRALANLSGVLRVQSVVDLDPSFTKADYAALLTLPAGQQPPPVVAAVNATVGGRLALLSVLTASPPASDEARALLDDIRATPGPADAEVLVTGATAFDVDTIGFILARVPAAVAYVVGVTFLLLLILVGSVLLPLKAVLMNLLSISASFGALVWIFQQGNLSAILDFTPSSIDPSLPVIMFCIVFGLSMDYEVLLLSRMQEEYEQHGDNERAVAEGLEASGRLITGAAAIMVLVFSAFATSGVLIVKAIGLGLAIAVALDATIVRALVVPATMRLLGDLNWWAPGPLRRLHEKI